MSMPIVAVAAGRGIVPGRVLLLWALFGAFGGAVAYRLADRLLEGESAGPIGWTPRCTRCGRAESPLRRIALLAFVLRRRCPGCGLGPSRRQAAVELLAAVLIALLAWRIDDPVQAGIHALATLVLLATTLTDLRARLIPNALTYPASLAALAASALPGGIGPLDAVGGGLAAGLIAVGMLLLGLFMYRRADVFGMGDVKLALFIGLVAGSPLPFLPSAVPPRALWAIAAGIVAGGVIGMILVVAGRSSRSTMPYGPALAIGAYLVFLLRPV
jgi:prepilin signal peptidase PulO-like enzyme (type II secretory pathway)